MTAVNFPNSPSNGDTHTVGTTTYTYNSTKGYWDATPTGSSINLASVGQHVIPSADNTYDLGSSSKKWRSIYVDAGTINIGSQTIKATSSGIQLPEVTIGTGTTTLKLGVDASGNLKQTPTVGGSTGSEVQTVALTDLSATTASAGTAGLAYNNTTGAFTYTPTDISAKADLASPTLTGTPAAPTASASTNTTQIATTAFVQTELAGLVDSAPGALNTLNELAAAINDDASFSTTITTSLAAKAPLASPALTGTPTAPTAATSDDSTKIATTAYVVAKVGASGGATTLNGLTDVNTSGVSTGQVLSYTGSAWGVADAGSSGSGGSIELTADGAITAGKAVTIEASTGKAKQVGAAADFTGSTTISPTHTNYDKAHAAVYNSNKNRYLFYTGHDNGNSYVFAATRSGSSITYGSTATHSDGSQYTGAGPGYVIADSNTGREFIFYGVASTGSLAYREITGTGTSVSIGSATVAVTRSAAHTLKIGDGVKHIDFGNGEFLITYMFSSGQGTGDDKVVYSLAFTVPASGAPSFGTPTEIPTLTALDIRTGSDQGGVVTVKDAVSATKGLIRYIYVESGTEKHAFAALTFSGTGTSRVISAVSGAVNHPDASATFPRGSICATPGTEDSFVISQRIGDAGTVCVVTVSGGSLSFGARVTTLATGSNQDTSAAIASSNSNDNEVIIYDLAVAGGSLSSGKSFVRVGTVSGTSITVGTQADVYTTNGSASPSSSGALKILPDSAAGIYFLSQYSGDASGQTNHDKSVGMIIGRNQPSSKEQWVGIAQSTVSDGATVGIDLPGGINTQQSGMTIEGTYYVQDDGDIETGVTTEVAGVALSATKLLVADNTANSQANIPLSSYATTAAVNAKADLASPALTGTPSAPTAAVGTNTTQVATTAFVLANAGSTAYSEITSATTAVAGNVYIINTGAAVTLTLPASASIGDKVGVIDGTGTAATNNITIGRNSHKIQGDAADMTVSLNRAAFELVYYNATHGWLLTKV